MPITGTPAAAAATATDPAGGPRNGTASPAELSTLVIACTAAGCGREARAACTVAGAPMPLIPQAPDAAVRRKPLQLGTHLLHIIPARTRPDDDRIDRGA